MPSFRFGTSHKVIRCNGPSVSGEGDPQDLDAHSSGPTPWVAVRRTGFQPLSRIVDRSTARYSTTYTDTYFIFVNDPNYPGYFHFSNITVFFVRCIVVLFYQIRVFIRANGDRLKGVAVVGGDMATDGDVDTTRTTVKTYVPAYQREAWDAHADELEMSRSEYVRSMVQAGRRGFGAEKATGEADDEGPTAPPGKNGDDEAAIQETRPFETQIMDALSTAAYLSWDELVEAITQDIEDELETTLQELQADNVVMYSGPNGGYTIDE
jgi:hypothetical protein